jgi:hypothetical protein
MILNSTKFGGNQRKDVEVGPDRQADSYISPPPPNYDCGGYKMSTSIRDFRLTGSYTVIQIHDYRNWLCIVHTDV